MQFLDWLYAWPISEWIQTSEWGFPVMLSFHSIGLAVVVGILLMIDARLLGVAKSFPVTSFANLMIFAWSAFFVNAASGILLFAADAPNAVSNWAFWLKMSAVALGIITAYLTSRELNFPAYQRMSPAEAEAAGEPVITSKLKALATASVIFWITAIVAGRMIAYIADHARMFKVDF